eukprot:CAMPEP_0185182916 /NCGR_PEP_ID=MMETSP1140-20130426/1651_1 /TAXON_ID=298111 /ORGANISM="Pavlova sp., Strain CCMP459" /LENGTH=64 /DNA_ID=CAMNT_0027748887 /DNA_START=47 /DNA_END=237 /DNA_ORIENTATION=+
MGSWCMSSSGPRTGGVGGAPRLGAPRGGPAPLAKAPRLYWRVGALPRTPPGPAGLGFGCGSAFP